MNLIGDEKRIQRLFREMSLEDARRMPQFARMMEVASSRQAVSRYGIRPMRLAAVVATLVVVALLAVLVVRQKQAGAEQKPAEQAEVMPAPETSQQEAATEQKTVRSNA